MTCLRVLVQEYERISVADALVPKTFTEGQCIIRQVKVHQMLSTFIKLVISLTPGWTCQRNVSDREWNGQGFCSNSGNRILFIFLFFPKSSEENMSQLKKKTTLDVAVLGRGQYFGGKLSWDYNTNILKFITTIFHANPEIALVTHEPRTASVYACDNVKLACGWLTFLIAFPYHEGFFIYAVLDTGAFERLLGSCVEVMKRNKTTYEDQLNCLMAAEMNLQSI